MKDLAVCNEWFASIFEIRTIQKLIDGPPHSVVVGDDLLNPGPVGRLILRQASAYRVDAECKQPIEPGVERRLSEGRGADHVPVECFKVAEIEDDAMPFRDWTLV